MSPSENFCCSGPKGIPHAGQDRANGHWKPTPSNESTVCHEFLLDKQTQGNDRLMHKSLRLLVTGLLLSGLSATTGFAQTAQVEFQTSSGTIRGKRVAHNAEFCWLADPDGRYTQVKFREVQSFGKGDRPFQVHSTLQVRESLKRDLGKGFEIVIRTPFVVAAPTGRAAAYAQELDQMARAFSRYASVRNLPVSPVEYPLVVLIFPDARSFHDYARSDEVGASSLLQGYYHPHSNRVALVEKGTGPRSDGRPGTPAGSPGQNLSDETVSTLIHEGIHQLAFNQRLHTRIGQNPRWIVEGLATMLEAEGSQLRSSGKQGAINTYRLQWFKKYRETARKETLAEFVAHDELYFRQNVLNAYSHAWALMYFLAENYPSQLPGYLRTVAERDPLAPTYSPQQRLADFEAAFGKDLAWLEVRFLRFIDALETR